MNQSELLDQFVLEARECLEAIGKGLLEVEREPEDATLLNDLFRSVHTLKGNCGLFEFKPLERVVHAGEDLLDRVRNQELAYSAELADALLDAMDFSAQLIDQIERSGRIEAGADARAQAHAKALRALLDGAPAEPPQAAQAAAEPAAHSPAGTAQTAAPDWLDRLDPALRAAHPGATAWRYQPEEGCFFKGEDPWRLACTTPGLLAVTVAGQQPWPEGEALNDWDCYQCRLDIVLLSSAPRADVQEHFRCVLEQLQGWQAPPAPPAEPTAAERAARARARQLWADQLALLARSTVAPGTVRAARRTLQRLLAWLDDGSAVAGLQALADDADAATLLAWARRHALPAEPATAEAAPGVAEAAAEPAAADPGRRGGDEANGAGAHKVLKVGQEKVDRLMDLIGEMVVAKNSLPYLAQRAETVFGQRELAREIKAQYTVINRIAEDMQHAIMQVRMLPVGAVFQRFGRLVRDISRKLGKEVHLVVEGEETEADKNVIESLADPLIHILRNSLDHGIETPQARRDAGKPAAGTIRIRAHQESDRVVIEISDDGAGVDAARVRTKAVERGLIPADRAATLGDHDAVQLIFLPGFSTAEQISDLSGRGVGMDVVRTAIERINGSVELSSVQGRGTTLRLSLPLSMAITNVMVIESAGRRFGVPMDLIVETVRVHGDDIHCFKQARTTVLRGRIVPLRALNELLALDTEPLKNADGELAVLVVRLGAEAVGLIVDQFHGASDIILKPLEGVLAGLTGFAGTALMGDGGVLMALNPKELLTWASAT
ncbi:chemotaxis protein CheA [Rubrivivax gelatinosus]|uniref:chemotaxis protein CheA n=1 Tax=Rubrivivax gelatinosus TaxID=28068 RepID=UPI003A7FF885